MNDRTEPTTPADVTAADMAAIFTGPMQGRDYDEMPEATGPAEDSATEQAEALDERFNHGLIYDVVKVLEDHGYKLPPVAEDCDATAHHRALGQTVEALLHLVRTFEGGDL